MVPFLFAAVCVTATAQIPPSVVWQAKATNSYTLGPVALSPDSGVVATLGTNNTVQIWRMSDGAPLRALSGHSAWVSELAFSPNGALLQSWNGCLYRMLRPWGIHSPRGYPCDTKRSASLMQRPASSEPSRHEPSNTFPGLAFDFIFCNAFCFIDRRTFWFIDGRARFFVHSFT